MRCNWRRWLWGIIPLLVLSWVAVQAEHSRLERDLAERARLALVEGGFTWAQAEFKARDALLMGRAPREGEPGKAADALAAVWGVRVVDNKADLLDKAEKYVWTASRRNNRIRLSGYAPSIDTRRAILGVTKASFPGFEIVDRTTLARGSSSSDVWLAGVSFALKQLTAIKRGDVRLEDLGLTVTGQAEDVTAYRTIKQALANSVPKGISVTADLVTAPVASPYMWAAHSADGRLVLSGHVPNDAVRADLVAAAKEGLPRAAIVDQMQPGEGAPQGWVDIAVAILREMGRLQGGGADMKDATLVVSGLAADAATAEAIRATLRAAVPATIKLTDQIQVKEPAPPALPTPSVAPPERSETPAKGPEAASSARTDTAAQSAPPPSVVPTERPETPTKGPGVASSARTDTAAQSTPPPSVMPTERSETPAKGPGVASPARTDTAAQSAPPVAPPVEGPALLRARACKEQLASVAAAGHILFRLASAELESTSFQTLDKLAEAAKSCPGMRIEVGGHASSEGSAELNQRLSLRRAQSVVAYLVHAGVDVAQLEPIGHGAAQPVAPNDGSQNMARNRRIEFTVRPK
jgi:outer membrane protein OmpA-like peptidoglycan-associated protein